MPPYRIPIEVRFADLDALGHVNSTRILAYAEHARVSWMMSSGFAQSPATLPLILASAQVQYLAPILLGQPLEVSLRVPRIGTKSWDWEYEVRGPAGTAQVCFATLRTVQVAYDYAGGQSRPVSPSERALLEGLRGDA